MLRRVAAKLFVRVRAVGAVVGLVVRLWSEVVVVGCGGGGRGEEKDVILE